MLGLAIINDPNGVEGMPGTSEGLGFLDVSTELAFEKQLARFNCFIYRLIAQEKTQQYVIVGYQIHVGKSTVRENKCFAILDNGTEDGAISEDNQVAGTYLHGIFDNIEVLKEILAWAGANVDIKENYNAIQEKEINRIADMCNTHLDWNKLLNCIRTITQ